jgi:hypothetical protein
VSQSAEGSVAWGAQGGLGVHGPRFSVPFALFLALAASGCGPADQCEEGASHCDGKRAFFCARAEDGNGGHTVWVSDDCADGFCQKHDEYAFCALEETPEPKCKFDAVQTRSSHCEGKFKVDCVAGYAIQRADCTLWNGTPDPDASCYPFEFDGGEYAGCN